MVKITRIEINGGFRSFSQPQVVDFPTSGCVLLESKNLDTQGSSGAGKTNLVHAINYGFGTAALPASTLQSWNNPEPFQVVYTLDTHLGQVILSRGAKNYLQIPGQKKITSITVIDAKVKELVGVYDSTMLTMLTYRAQREKGLFLGMSDTEKKEFLTGAIGLDKLEYEYELAKERVTKAQSQVSKATSELEVAQNHVDYLNDQVVYDISSLESKLNTALADLETALGELPQLEMDYKQSRALYEKAMEESVLPVTLAKEAGIQLKQDIETKKQAIKLDFVKKEEIVRAKYRKSLESADIRLNSLKIKDNEKKIKIDSQKAALEVKLRGVNNSLFSLEGVAKSMVSLGDQLAKLLESKCPTCDKVWDKAKIKAEETSASWHNCQSQLEQKAGLLELKDTLQKQISECVFEPDQSIAKFQQIIEEIKLNLNNEINELSIQIQDANHKLENELQAARENWLQLDSEYKENLKKLHQTLGIQEKSGKLNELKNSKIPNLERFRAHLENQYNEALVFNSQMSVSKKEALAKLEIIKAKLAEAESQLAIESDWCVTIKGYLAVVFDEILADIAHETNKLLAKVPNVAHCLLSFKSEVEQKNGKTAKRIVPVVTVGAKQDSYKSALSGGMQSVLELAVDLALGAVMRNRTGNCPGWLILDECFEGLGTKERESILEILQEASQDRLIVCIDHASEFKEAFSNTITIEYQNGMSNVVKTN